MLESINEEGSQNECADWPTDPSILRDWRGRAKQRNTRSINTAWQATLSHGDRDAIRGMRAVIVQNYEELTERHDWLIKHMDLTEKEGETEAAWLKTVTDNHYRALEFIDKYLEENLQSTPSHHSGFSNHSSTSSTRARLLEAERTQQEAELKLQQVREENQKRMEEDAYLLKLKAEEGRINAERENGKPKQKWKDSV